MTDKPKLGVLLPTRRLIMTGEEPQNIEAVLSMAEQVEKAGLDSVWVGDSLTAKPRLEPLTTLAAIASRTSRVRLGTSVLLAALRHPVTLAHVLGSLDLISGGRAVIGAGVGGAFNDDQRQEWRNAGVDPRRRAGRFEEVVDVAKRLTAGEVVTHHGAHFDFESLRVQPHALQHGGVPFLLACHWNTGREAQFRRAARLGDGIISISDYPDEYARLVETVQGYSNEYGKDPSKLERAFYMTVNLQADEAKADAEANQFLHLYYGMNFWGDRWGPYGHPERTIERMRRYVEAGAETIIVRFAALDQERQLDTFLNDVAPEFS
ncbi:MAG: LLM class flavin-dependent oxidoreductase [Chloroflexi bacterium]|nr:LLM class flavin-dependent oxidoreductase [Chloroflexota bacterium]